MNKIKSIISKILYPIYFFRATNAYKRAVHAAEENLKNTGCRTYVIKGSGGKLLLIDKANFKLMKRKRIINPKATVMDLENRCLYCTTYANGKGIMPQLAVDIKRIETIDWLIQNYRN